MLDQRFAIGEVAVMLGERRCSVRFERIAWVDGGPIQVQERTFRNRRCVFLRHKAPDILGAIVCWMKRMVEAVCRAVDSLCLTLM